MRVIYIIWVILLYITAVSGQIDILYSIQFEGGQIIGAKNYNNNLIATIISRNDSIFFQSSTLYSKGYSNSITGNFQTAFICSFDSNFNLKKFHKFYCRSDLVISDPFIAKEGIIYFTLGTYTDSIYFDNKMYLLNSKESNLFVRYDPASDSLTLQKYFKNAMPYNTIIKQFADNLYISQMFQGNFNVDSINYTTSGSSSDWDNIILILDLKTNKFIKDILIKGDDTEEITDIYIKSESEIFVTGEFWGSYVIINNDTIFNSKSRAYDGFLFKINIESNNIEFKKRFGGNKHELPKLITFNTNNNLIVYGQFIDSFLMIDNFVILNTSTGKNIFSAEFNQNGDLLRLYQFNNENDVYISNKTVVNIENKLIVGGSFRNKLEIKPNEIYYSLNKNVDGFLAIGNFDCTFDLGNQITGNGDDVVNYLSYDVDNNLLSLTGTTTGESIKFLDKNINYTKKIDNSFIFIVKINNIKTGIMDVNQSLNVDKWIEFYPNPVDNYLNIINKVNKRLDIEIYNILGNKLYTTQTVRTPIKIQTIDLPVGIYLIKVIDSESNVINTSKFLKI